VLKRRKADLVFFSGKLLLRSSPEKKDKCSREVFKRRKRSAQERCSREICGDYDDQNGTG
jgi:hypothetical protein